MYLDIIHDGSRKKEFLGLYVVPELTRDDKLMNKNVMKLAEGIRAQRMVELMEVN